VAVVRDQKPLKFIETKISPTSDLQSFLMALNSRVYFAPSRDRLERLLTAKEYRGQRQVILTIDTASLVERYGDVIELCRFNAGACTQVNHPERGHDSRGLLAGAAPGPGWPRACPPRTALRHGARLRRRAGPCWLADELRVCIGSRRPAL